MIGAVSHNFKYKKRRGNNEFLKLKVFKRAETNSTCAGMLKYRALELLFVPIAPQGLRKLL